MGIGVKRKSENESIDSLLKRFGKIVSRSGVLYEYREGMRYTKPSDKRREEKKKVQRKKDQATNF